MCVCRGVIVIYHDKINRSPIGIIAKLLYLLLFRNTQSPSTTVSRIAYFNYI